MTSFVLLLGFNCGPPQILYAGKKYHNKNVFNQDSFNLYILNSYAYLVWHMQLCWEAEDKYI